MAGSNFVDYVKICCRSGKGGGGSAHFHRDKTTAKGGPDGGDGGRGGHIIMRGNSNQWPLLHLEYKRPVMPSHGENGSGNQKQGGGGRCMDIGDARGTIRRDAGSGGGGCRR